MLSYAPLSAVLLGDQFHLVLTQISSSCAPCPLVTRFQPDFVGGRATGGTCVCACVCRAYAGLCDAWLTVWECVSLDYICSLPQPALWSLYWPNVDEEGVYWAFPESGFDTGALNLTGCLRVILDIVWSLCRSDTCKCCLLSSDYWCPGGTMPCVS